MAMTNHERVGKALDLLRDGLVPYVEREMKEVHGAEWFLAMRDSLSEQQAAMLGDEANPKYDARSLLAILWGQWNDVFKSTLGLTERSIVSELRGAGNKWAHQEQFSSRDALRFLDSASRLLSAIGAEQADAVDRMYHELNRQVMDEQIRSEKKKEARTTIESAVTGSLKPWREVVSPHPDVASGNYQQAEFAADLWQVHLGEGSPEYRDPGEFFRRTFMTESLTRLLADAVRRLTTGGGAPVVQLQTNFGGGKTHSMLALYHLVSGRSATELLGVEDVLRQAESSQLPKAKRVVLVGSRISPGNPSIKADGTVVHTLWGELAYQLGGKSAYEKIRADDERATSPGDRLKELFDEHDPCLILIDEWVAYARQLRDQSDLPGGSFETQFSFAQALTESAKNAKRCLLVISLPASDTAGTAEDIEVGGQRGREALARLRHVIGRVESSWRPASAEEGFEIVRRRLFEPLLDPELFKTRDYVARSFYDLYRTQHQEFPNECRDAEYEERLKMAYPIHPEVFDRLHTDWSALPKFQRTRGVLRLMAAVIHSLWTNGDRNPLILPGNIPIDDPRVQFELTRYLPDQWEPVIAKDVDGANALPLRIDSEVPNLGRYHASRRVARAIYLGSAPITSAANRGLEDRRVKLGCVMPGEQPAIFGDALRRLAAAATYLYQDGPRYWYSTQPTVAKLAEDRAEQFRRDYDAVVRELENRVRRDLQPLGDFSRVHAFPQSGADVPDDHDARLVVLGIEQPYTKEDGNAAEAFAKEILRSRGNSPRLYQNSLVFLAVDKTKLQDLDEALRRFLAWKSILEEKDALDLSPHQVRQAEAQRSNADGAVVARIPEAYQWLLVPVQENPHAQVEWNAYRLTGSDPLAVRAGKKLRNDELLLTSFAPSRLKMELDRIPLWGGKDQSHVAIADLVDYFSRYLYLPRLKVPGVLLASIQDGLKLLTWKEDSFAYADSLDEDAGRYRGLVVGSAISLGTGIPDGLLVKADVALHQLATEIELGPGKGTNTADTVVGPSGSGSITGGPFGNGNKPPAPTERPTRFHGSVTLDANRVGRDAARIADEVLSHLAGIVGANVKVTLEVEATISEGVPDDVVRIITQNGRDLKFDTLGFEGGPA